MQSCSERLSEAARSLKPELPTDTALSPSSTRSSYLSSHVAYLQQLI